MKIIFLHGITGSPHNFDDLKKYFPESVSIPIIGFGKAEKPEGFYDKEFFMKYLDIKITEPCILIGHSMGSILAKDFAIRHPDLVKQLFLISYPLQENIENLKEALSKVGTNKHYIRNDWQARMIDIVKNYDRYIVHPLLHLFRIKNAESIIASWDYTHTSITNALNNYILKDNHENLDLIKDKAFFISGSKDPYTDLEMLGSFKHAIIPGMKHLFWKHEKEIAKIIKDNFKINF